MRDEDSKIINLICIFTAKLMLTTPKVFLFCIFVSYQSNKVFTSYETLYIATLNE